MLEHYSTDYEKSVTYESDTKTCFSALSTPSNAPRKAAYLDTKGWFLVNNTSFACKKLVKNTEKYYIKKKLNYCPRICVVYVMMNGLPLSNRRPHRINGGFKQNFRSVFIFLWNFRSFK